MSRTAGQVVATVAAPGWLPRPEAPLSPAARSAAERIAPMQSLHAAMTAPGRHAVLLGERGTGRSTMLRAVARFPADASRVIELTARADDAPHAVWSRALATLGAMEAHGPDAIATAFGVLDGPTLVLIDDAELWDASTDAFADATLNALVRVAPGVTVVLARTPSRDLESIHATTVPLPRLTPAEAAELLRATLAANGVEIEAEAAFALAALSCGLPGEAQRLALIAVRHLRDDGRAVIGPHDIAPIRALALEGADTVLGQAWAQATIRARRGIFPEILLACALTPHAADGSFCVNDARAELERLLKREIRGLTNQISVLAEHSRGRALEKVAPAPNARYRFLDARLEPYALLRPFEGREMMLLPGWLSAAGDLIGRVEEARQAA